MTTLATSSAPTLLGKLHSLAAELTSIATAIEQQPPQGTKGASTMTSSAPEKVERFLNRVARHRALTNDSAHALIDRLYRRYSNAPWRRSHDHHGSFGQGHWVVGGWAGPQHNTHYATADALNDGTPFSPMPGSEKLAPLVHFGACRYRPDPHAKPKLCGCGKRPPIRHVFVSEVQYGKKYEKWNAGKGMLWACFPCWMRIEKQNKAVSDINAVRYMLNKVKQEIANERKQKRSVDKNNRSTAGIHGADDAGPEERRR